MKSDNRLPLKLGLEAARREAAERGDRRAQAVAPIEAAPVTPEAPQEAPQEASPAANPQAASDVVRTVGFNGTIIETNVYLDAPPPVAWSYQRTQQARRASPQRRR